MEMSTKIEPYIYFTRTTNNKSADARIKSSEIKSSVARNKSSDEKNKIKNKQYI